ncbi:helix-turn-helix domain-containing protein [Aggregatimonas sangjinii]|uniref:Helix-turn-helix domain-containing protein n=1 Tax=Aggregatimonas sangjinii TaxID=2583587 RepID=A0A5B7SPP3_9FLAO|nr:AraC family transcriptional regulator [Aggregatimonas sangjinii]QCW98962.1 helix-turn-helix domain-containing protein [Aggregatimonas sangjinii]
MIAIEVNSLPIAEVMDDIAKAFETKYIESCGTYYLDLPSHIGEGNIRGVSFDGGMGIVQYDCIFKEAIEFQFTINEIHPLKFLYCLKGSLLHRFENYEDIHEINHYQEAIVASDFFNGHVLRFQPKVHTVVNSLEITRKEFQKKVQCELVTMDQTLQDLFNDIEARKSFYHEGFYSLKLADLFREMQTFEERDFLKKLFLEGKAYQMLTAQILQYQDDLEDASNRSILRQSEIKQIESAAKLIKKQISELETISDIAGEVGLNNNKLQEGFQNLYGVTVNQYIQQVRLDLIKDLILNTEYSISEIVDLVGLNSKSYLSKIFRDEYGTTPSEYRKHFMETLLKKRAKT